MCGRYTLFADVRFIEDAFGIRILDASVIPKNYNVAPSTVMPVIRNDRTGLREVTGARWGLIPAWSKDDRMSFATINARAESLEDKAAFREPFRRQRCLVPANGFYEWLTRGKRKFPYYIHTPGRPLVAYAGLWDRWREPGGAWVDSFTIVTTTANETVRPLHERMPVILNPSDYAAWLEADTPPEVLKALCRPFPAGDMAAYPVSEAVNGVKTNRPELIQEAGHEKDLFD